MGPPGNEVFFYGLTSIAVDYVKIMSVKFGEGSGWTNLPKNFSNVKAKIVQTCLQTRRMDNHKFILDQTRFVQTLHGIWGTATATLGVHDNDKVQLFGILMSFEKNRPLFQRLAEGATERCQLNSSELSISGIFTRILFDFHNEDIVVVLPKNAGDVDGVDDLDPNDMTRIRIDRDCKYIRYHAHYCCS